MQEDNSYIHGAYNPMMQTYMANPRSVLIATCFSRSCLVDCLRYVLSYTALIARTNRFNANIVVLDVNRKYSSVALDTMP